MFMLYVFSMESSIRYMLNTVTKTHDEELVPDLGPLAFALKLIVGSASLHRTESMSEKKTKFWTFIGMPLMDTQISDIKELEPTKKEAAGSMNLFGFNACYDRRMAQTKAWEHLEKSTTPCIFQIEFNSSVNNFKLDKPEYTPYFQTEQFILLQDGI